MPGEYPIFVWEAADGGRMAMKGRSGSMAMSEEIFKEYGNQPNLLKLFLGYCTHQCANLSSPGRGGCYQEQWQAHEGGIGGEFCGATNPLAYPNGSEAGQG
jgi:hypothetical protein